MFAGRKTLAVLVFSPFLFCGHLSAAAADDRPVDVSPAANVDENLFLVRALSHEYNQWPQDAWDGKAALKFCEESRLHVKFLRTTAAQRQMDAGFRGMCDDFLTLIDEYESTLARLGDMDAASRKKAFEDALSTFVVGSLKGLKAGNDVAEQGGSDLQVDVAVGKSLVDDGLKEFIKHSNARNAETNDAASAEQSRFVQVRDYAMERNHVAAEAMTERYHWTEGEAGFDQAAATATLDVLAKRRPRDPFVKVDLAAQGLDNNTTPDDLMARANLCIEAARLIPGDPAYQFYRLNCLGTATTYACNAAEMGIGSTYRDAPTAHSQKAINITQAMLQGDPEDHDGWIHLELFRALACAGRFDEAVQAAAPILDSPWKQNRPFAVRYTRVMGVTGDVDRTEQWLRWSYALGFAELDFVKKSGDFDALRTQKPQAYAELTTIKGTTRIDFGLVDDDVVVINRSPFPITNLKLTFRVIKGGQIWDRERVLPFVAGNSKETLGSVFMIPGSQYDAFRWTLTSDQGKLSSEDE